MCVYATLNMHTIIYACIVYYSIYNNICLYNVSRKSKDTLRTPTIFHIDAASSKTWTHVQ